MEQKSIGPIIGLIIILAIIIIGAVYFLKNRPSNIQGQTPVNGLSTGNDISSLEKDLDNTNLGDIDQALSGIETELTQ